jgi:hypothetical protein
VDAVSDDRGQALVLAVLAVAIAAASIVGLLGAEDRILGDARDRRAGEAAIEAAGAALADAQVDLLASRQAAAAGGRAAPSRSELDALITDPLVVERSLRAADALSAANGGPPAKELALSVGVGTLDIALSVGAHRLRASIETTCCRR